METNNLVLDVELFTLLLKNGLKNLKINAKTVNDLNVFPVPDGDTGSNMTVTFQNGIKYIQGDERTLEELTAHLSKGMLLGARGNSGVILSQFFKGLADGFVGVDKGTSLDLVNALVCGYKVAYNAVVNPTEGTILTVLREAIELTKDKFTAETSIYDVLNAYLEQAKITLADTINRLDILKEAGVIDSGGAGFVAIIDGMVKQMNGEELKDITIELPTVAAIDTTKFTADSELTYGYCTEFILQLQNRKIAEKPFNLNDFISYLKTIGDSIVATQLDTVVKVHVHTKTPALAISKAQEYGEFVTFKMENMTLQNEEVKNKHMQHKAIGYIGVSNGEGVSKIFQDLGTDIVLFGGQTMNVSTEEFLQAFDNVNADSIIVMPNNKNIILAAEQAKKMYGTNKKIFILPTKSIAQGYFALSTLNETNDPEEQLENMKYGINGVVTIETTYAIRDTKVNGVECKKGDFISLVDGQMLTADADLIASTINAIEKVEDFEDKDIVIIFKGKDLTEEAAEKLQEMLEEKYPYKDFGIIDGEQDVYPIVLAIS